MNKEVLLQKVTVARSENERVLIEPSVNSLRVSIKIKQADEIEQILCRKFTSFLMQRSEQFVIMRRKAIKVIKLDIYRYLCLYYYNVLYTLYI